MADLFEGTTPTIDPNKNYLEELVGEGRKFKSPEDLARGKAESDTYITTLKAELETAKQELQTRARLEELITKISPTKQPDPDPSLHNQTTEGQNVMNGLTPEQLEELLEKKLRERDQTSNQQRNLAVVKEELSKKYGTSTQEVLEKATVELGVSKEWINGLAAENPKAFMRLIGEAAPKQSGSLFNSPAVNSSSFQPETGTRTRAWYQALKKSDPKRYESPEIQAQEYKDAVKLGEAFFS